jgi:solute carrier family 35, member E3
VSMVLSIRGVRSCRDNFDTSHNFKGEDLAARGGQIASHSMSSGLDAPCSTSELNCPLLRLGLRLWFTASYCSNLLKPIPATAIMPDERPSTMNTTDILTRDSYSDHLSEDESADLLKHSQQDEEKQAVEEEGQTEQATKKSSSTAQFLAWTVINTLATIAIVSTLVASSARLIEQVFTNKEIFKDRSLKRNQSTFAAFHFTVTAATLWYASRPSWGMFVPQRAGLVQMLPLGIAMCLNVILPNLSLAYSSVAFYQIVRVLLTPLVAIINFAFYGAQMPRKAVYTLLPICLGVGIVSYYDTQPGKGKQVHSSQTSPAGILFAFSGVVASSLYTVWIGTYHKEFKLNSMQLLFNQAPISAFLLLYVIPFTDQSPNWSRLEGTKWVLILFVSNDGHRGSRMLTKSRVV